MIDMTPEALPEVAQLWAQANVPGISQPANDWIGDNPVRRKNIESAVRGPNAAQDLQYRKVQYSDSGPLKIPTLKHERDVDYAPRPDGTGRQVPHEQLLSLASESCAILDMLAGKAGAWGPECKITQILQKPSGKLVPDTNPGARQGDFLYIPSRAGVHTARFILENGAGRKVDVTVKIRATLDLPEEGASYSNPDESNLLADLGVSDLAAWQRSANLSALIAGAQQSFTGFSNLPSTALGQTTGEGLSAQITLDTNAAGHNWYIDPTPLDNSDDYLPTSDASVWKAKAGSEAAGKMDMLSVLLHEYGHALGLEHSGAASDFMAASLQPGVRKLPSAAELTVGRRA